MRKRRTAWMLAIVAYATAITGLVTAQEVQPWIHVEIAGQAGENANINLPVAVVDALFSSEGDNLNIAAAVGELKNLRGNIITVSEENRQIRVWIDEVAEQ